MTLSGQAGFGYASVVTEGRGCYHGNLRLISTGADHNAGTVEICYNGQWQPIHDSQWDDWDAEVACGQLGFAKQGLLFSTYSSRHVYHYDYFSQ